MHRMAAVRKHSTEFHRSIKDITPGSTTTRLAVDRMVTLVASERKLTDSSCFDYKKTD
ncbi:hypothetical protein [Mediterraneibacter sp.]